MIEHIMHGFCEDTIRNYIATSQNEVTNKRYKLLGKVCIQYSILISRFDYLYEDLFEFFQKIKKEELFLELLPPFILEDKLPYLHPLIMQKMVDLYSETGKVREIEELILHLDISSLDFHQVVSLCRKFNLFSALFYLYNKGLDDFISPLVDLINVVHSLKQQSPDYDPTVYHRPLLTSLISFSAYF